MSKSTTRRIPGLRIDAMGLSGASEQVTDSARHEAMRRASRGMTVARATASPIKRQGPDETGYGPSIEAVNAAIANAMSEDTWRSHIRQIAGDAGFRRQYHTGFSIKSDPGFPDDVFVNTRDGRLIFMEAKRQNGNGAVLSYDQVAWLDDLAFLRDGGIRIEIYGAVRPMDRDAVVKMLMPSAMIEGTPLHQWCRDNWCKRCSDERTRAKPGKSKGRRSPLP